MSENKLNVLIDKLAVYYCYCYCYNKMYQNKHVMSCLVAHRQIQSFEGKERTKKKEKIDENYNNNNRNS